MGVWSIHKKQVRFGIGLTAGASCAGIDAALVRLKGSGPGLHLKLLHSEHFEYPRSIRQRMLASRKDSKELGLLNFELGSLMAEAAASMKRVVNQQLEEADYVALQGYLASHMPRREGALLFGGLQIGEPAIVAHKLGLPVISDFITRDVVAGGGGKPLSSYADWQVFARSDRIVACLHLGALASLTIVTPALEDVLAFEIGPCNMLIDSTVRFLMSGNRDMDTGGEAAAQGQPIDEFLEHLLSQPYYDLDPPRTVTCDDFSDSSYLRDALAIRRGHSFEDLMATVTLAVAQSILRAYTQFVKPRYEIVRLIIDGGGACNSFLVEQIQKGIPEATIRISDTYGLPYYALDPLRVAILGNETVSGKPGNCPHASRAQEPVILGNITLA